MGTNQNIEYYNEIADLLNRLNLPIGAYHYLYICVCAKIAELQKQN